MFAKGCSSIGDFNVSLRRELLAQLRAAFPDLKLTIIGANAIVLNDLDLKRTTHDLDVIVPLEVDTLLDTMAAQPGWQKPPRSGPQRRIVPDGTPTGTPVDLLPAAPKHLRAGEVEWPGTGIAMNLTGFQHAVGEDARGVIDAGLGPDIRVASPPLIVLLKIGAWTDQPYDRDKDLGDIAAVMEGYIDDADDRAYEGAAADIGLFGEDASAWWLGFDLGGFIHEAERHLVSRFLSAVDDPNGQLAQTIAALAPPAWRRDEDEARRRFRLFKRGLDTALNQRTEP